MLLCSNPHAQYLAHQVEIDAAIRRVLDKGWYILGGEVKAFEAEFAAWVGAAHAIGVGSGTEALHLAIRACGIGSGDEVITVSHTAVATVAAIEAAGATPVLVDIDPRHFTMDPARFEAAITARTKAVIPVHLYGQPADLGAILPIARRHALRVIEDCAQAHGAEIDLRPETLDLGPGSGDLRPETLDLRLRKEKPQAQGLGSEVQGLRSKVYGLESAVQGPRSKVQGLRLCAGSLGDLACFSFYPTKNLGALGDGGAIVTSDPALAERCRLLREYGWAERYVSHIQGFNSRLDELQAAVLRVKLPHLDADNAKRVRIAAQYDAGLAGTRLVLPGAGRPEALDSRHWTTDHGLRATDHGLRTTDHGAETSDHGPQTMDCGLRTTDHRSPITDRASPSASRCPHVYHLYVVRSERRDALQAHLKGQGIGALIHYPVPVHLQPAYRGRIPIGAGLPETERASREVLSLPMYPELTEDEVKTVIEAIRSFAAG